jgi:hypothetical protein
VKALGALHSEKFVFVCQKGALITSPVLIPLGFLWWYSGELFNLIMSDKELASMAGKCMKYVIPGTNQTESDGIRRNKMDSEVDAIRFLTKMYTDARFVSPHLEKWQTRYDLPTS